MSVPLPAAWRTRALARRARYRVRQFTRGLRPRLGASEVAMARPYLREDEVALFLGATPRDRRHSMDLFHLLRQEGVSGVAASDALLVAALLHDVGKGEVNVLDRVGFVLVGALGPWLLDRLAAPDGARWRQAMWRLRHHAELGASILDEAGADARVVAIVRAHTDHVHADPEIAAFIRADDRV